MNFDPKLGSFLLFFVCAVSGWVVWWLNKIKFEKQQIALEREQAIQKAEAAAEKAVNDRRDFNHLIGNQREISKNIAYGFKDIENQIKETNEKLQEIKVYLIRNQHTNHDQ
ncbi:MAG: hypothetical protein V7K18_08405 [Nostoc sp.]|uniref:hypothetical protein n=1 Tax=Nostoc sp. TaxID=1180 RepID=UPI002FFBB0A1